MFEIAIKESKSYDSNVLLDSTASDLTYTFSPLKYVEYE